MNCTFPRLCILAYCVTVRRHGRAQRIHDAFPSLSFPNMKLFHVIMSVLAFPAPVDIPLGVWDISTKVIANVNAEAGVSTFQAIDVAAPPTAEPTVEEEDAQLDALAVEGDAQLEKRQAEQIFEQDDAILDGGEEVEEDFPGEEEQDDGEPAQDSFDPELKKRQVEETVEEKDAQLDALDVEGDAQLEKLEAAEGDAE